MHPDTLLRAELAKIREMIEAGEIVKADGSDVSWDEALELLR